MLLWLFCEMLVLYKMYAHLNRSKLKSFVERNRLFANVYQIWSARLANVLLNVGRTLSTVWQVSRNVDTFGRKYQNCVHQHMTKCDQPSANLCTSLL